MAASESASGDKNIFIVTGSRKGIGAALVAALREDAQNIVIGLSRDQTTHHPHFNVQVDLADHRALPAAFAQCMALVEGQQFARAVLINNAGIVQPVGRFDHLDVEAEALTRNFAVNLTAPMLLTSLFAQATAARAAQRLVINISSGAAKRAIAGWSAYCAAKAALEMATRVAALEAAPDLAICSLAPGVVDTPMQATVRSVDVADFPDVARFQAMKADGSLRSAEAVAKDIIHHIYNNKFANGGNYDLREMNA